MINQNDLNLLVTLESIARTKSVKETAAEMSVTPSAISQALVRLEEQMGAQLFLREHKKIKISPAGLELLSSVRASLINIQNQLSDFKSQASSENPSGIVAVGCPTEIGTSFIIEWFSELQTLYPKIKIKLRLGSPRTLLSYLEKGEVDFLIADDGPYYDGLNRTLSIEKLFSEELIMCISKQQKEKLKLDTTFDHLVNAPHLDYSSDGSAVGIWYRHYFKKVPQDLELVMVSENVRALISGIKQNLGMAMIPKYLIVKELEKGSIIQISPSSKPLLNSMLLIQHQNKIPTKAEKIFLNMIRSKKGMIL